MGYVYPRAKRQTRDLLRWRSFFVRRWAQLIAQVVNTNTQFNLPPLPKKLTYAANRTDGLVDRFADPSTRLAIATDLGFIDGRDTQIAGLERHLVKHARVDDPVTFALLRTVPGIGPILGLTLQYEADDIARFPVPGNFLSYRRLVRCAHASAGKAKGSGPKKVGNAHRKRAFSEAARLMIRAVPAVKGVGATAGREGRQAPGAECAGGEARPHRVPPVAEGCAIRRQAVPEGLRRAKTTPPGDERRPMNDP
jgi:Transposase IS116/IS110/IS902 family